MARTEISTLGEFGLIKRLTSGLEMRNPSTEKGVGDDCAVLHYPDEQVLVTTDMLLEGVHFDLTYVPLKYLGYKAAIENISDIVAMNGKPQQMTVALGIGRRFCVENIEEIYEGLRHACGKYGVDLVGGDTTSSLTGLTIAITCIGSSPRDRIVYRSGAHDTDLVCVSGDLGAAYMGLQLLEREKTVFENKSEGLKGANAALEAMQPDFEGHEYLLQRQLKPEARRDITERLAEAGILPTSMIDISDGLSSELLHICEQSGTGCRIYEERIPIDYQTAALADEMKIGAITAALNGGEDYELLFTVPLTDYEKILKVEDVHVIGHITSADAGRTFVTSDGAEVELRAQGWNPLAQKDDE